VEVEINNLSSTVQAVDGDSLLTPKTMERIVSVVLEAIDERDGHRQRVRAEQRITSGVSYELEGRE
jgi:hypothetical protein